eukprot:TRINITY_DN10182_c0_g1_i1.p1 TRINITY_DN10182_c0_g1~~TRINITY_DN10182_c0_g1_i1.p1  ORF type:complete len:228 (-),score=41.42 TRINITY_DN10182_c0_g1_i1:605-1255(-)
MCGGYSCSKNTLIILNVCYMIVSFILIGTAVKEKAAGVVVSAPIIGGVTACGLFLLAISIVGLFGAMKHHQVWLFVYMVVLFLIFIIQFSVSCAALGVSKETEIKLVEEGWKQLQQNGENQIILTAEKTFNCCGLNGDNSTKVECEKLDCYKDDTCSPCLNVIQGKLGSAFATVGGLGLFFSLTELIGGVIACRYRNLIDPTNSGIGAAGGAAGGL